MSITWFQGRSTGSFIYLESNTESVAVSAIPCYHCMIMGECADFAFKVDIMCRLSGMQLNILVEASTVQNTASAGTV